MGNSHRRIYPNNSWEQYVAKLPDATAFPAAIKDIGNMQAVMGSIRHGFQYADSVSFCYVGAVKYGISAASWQYMCVCLFNESYSFSKQLTLYVSPTRNCCLNNTCVTLQAGIQPQDIYLWLTRSNAGSPDWTTEGLKLLRVTPRIIQLLSRHASPNLIITLDPSTKYAKIVTGVGRDPIVRWNISRK